MHDVADDERVPRLCAARAIVSVTAPPARDGVVTQQRELVALDDSAAVVAAEEDCISVDSREIAVSDERILCTLEQQRAQPLQRPVASARLAVPVVVVGERERRRGRASEEGRARAPPQSMRERYFLRVHEGGPAARQRKPAK